MSMIAPERPTDQVGRSFAAEQMEELNGEIARGVHMPELERQIVVGAIALEGALLFEGPPSTGKTRSAIVIATAIGGKLGRIQGNPDITPGDITGKRYYDMSTGEWKFMEGPINSNVVFADEINRAPTNAQSAFLEAMQEKQITIAGETSSRELPTPFIVMATQNPSEKRQGTNPLTVAQLDRFNVGITMHPLEEADHLAIAEVEDYDASQVININDVPAMKKAIESVAMPHDSKLRAIRIAIGLRNLGVVDSNKSALDGRRVAKQIERYAKALAMQQGDGVVSDDHVDQVAPYVTGHRTAFNYEGVEQNYTAEQAIEEVKESL